MTIGRVLLLYTPSVLLSTPKEYNPSSDFTLGKKRKREEEADNVEVGETEG